VRGHRHAAVWLGCLALMGGLVGACGDDDSGGGGGGGGGGNATEESGTTEGAKVIDPASMDGAKGEVTYCTGKDTSGAQKESVKLFNEKNQANGLSAKLLEFPESADEQRNQFIQRQEAKSGECDIFYSDVVWTAEFASQKWLYDMTPYVEKRKSEFIQAPIQTVTYENRQWGVPETTDAGFLYYNDEKIKSAPSTWQQVYQQAAQEGGIVYQGAAYEGLTCDFLELLFAAGGQVLNEDGSKAAINSPQAVKALQLMVDGIKNGAAPKAVTTYMEEPARRAFEAGRVTFLRNWPYVYATANRANATKGKFKVVPFPAWEGGGKAGFLGGANLVISTYSKNPGAALKFIDYMTSEDRQKEDIVKFSDASPLKAVYEDKAVLKAQPFSPELKTAVENSKARPVSPVYPQISQAIYKNVNQALSGQMSPEEALKNAQSEIEKALQTF
jgi:multiple sugar transport system substrate-binding protein